MRQQRRRFSLRSLPGLDSDRLGRKAGDGLLNFRENLGRFDDWSSPEVVLYDDFDPQYRIVRSAAEYGAILEPCLSSLNIACCRGRS